MSCHFRSVHLTYFLFFRNSPPTLSNPDCWSDEYKDFIGRCLIKNFEDRPSVAELFQHPFIQQVPKYPQTIKEELACVLHQHKRLGLLKVAPEVTTKCGRLKENRRIKPKLMSADDLAGLENLSEVIIYIKPQFPDSSCKMSKINVQKSNVLFWA